MWGDRAGPGAGCGGSDVGIPFRHLLLAVGLLELFIAFFCLFTDKRQFSLLAVVWLATNFVIYRVGLWWIGWHRPCGCLGNLTDLLGIAPHTADTIMKGVLAYLLIGSYGLLLWQWMCGQRPNELPQGSGTCTDVNAGPHVSSWA